MSRFARKGHHDANHGELAKVFTDLGCSVADISGAGWGIPDLLIGCVGITTLVEVKTDEGDIDPKQQRFARDWRGSRIVYARTVDQAIAHVQAIRRSVR